MLLTTTYLESSKHYNKFLEILETPNDKDKIEFFREQYLDIKTKGSVNNAPEGLKLYIYKYRYLMPVIEAMLFLYKTIYAEKFVEILSKYEFTLNGQVAPMTTKDLFSYLKSNEREMVKGIINKIECHQIISEQLFDAIVDDNYDMFTHICCNNNISLNKTIQICRLYESINLDFFINRNMEYSDGFNIKLLEFNYISTRTLNFFSYIESDNLLTRFYKERNNIIFLFIVILNFLEGIDNKYRSQIVSLLKNTEFEELNIQFKEYEKNHSYTSCPSEYSIIDKIRFELNLHYENLKPLDEVILPTSNGMNSTDNNKGDSNSTCDNVDKTFKIPENYFKEDPYKSKNEDREYYEYDTLFISKNNPEKFTKFINYLADCGYIDNDNETKMLFAYRLTGRMRPKELKKIVWHCQKKSKRGNELLYIAKYISAPNAKGKYKLTQNFFEGPIWGVKMNEDANDKNVITEFRKVMLSFYSEIFENKGNKLF